jgi:hypothetical protein
VRLLEYLVQVASTSLHTKSSAGLTPLALTFSLNRVTAARTLIAADADQTTRVDAQLAQKDRAFWRSQIGRILSVDNSGSEGE